MSFFNKEFLDFLKDLNQNNNREWFLENKLRYENHVKQPFEDFISDMIFRIREDDENLIISAKDAIFRIYRDIRFSKDKTPYKNHVSAIISNGGRKNLTDPGIYIEITHERLRFYSGLYQPNTEQLEKIRNHIVSNLNNFNKLLSDKIFKKYFGEILGEQNKRIPKEFNEAVKKQPLIMNKQFYFFAEIPEKKILSKNLSQELMKYYYAAKPLNVFFKEALLSK
ncbi:MAG: DUF2461 domain-containing protein [Ignavibacteriales bacterium]|nr:DUF2461 domain-containing protein [Ignavibacteriales bacterium]MCB9258455.1 DUF2461 domain-containing protein [Ignavibacteriales bacterium]